MLNTAKIPPGTDIFNFMIQNKIQNLDIIFEDKSRHFIQKTDMEDEHVFNQASCDAQGSCLRSEGLHSIPTDKGFDKWFDSMVLPVCSGKGLMMPLERAVAFLKGKRLPANYQICGECREDHLPAGVKQSTLCIYRIEAE